MHIRQFAAFAAAVSVLAVVRAAERNPWTHLNFDNDPEDFRFAIVPDRSGGDFRGAFTNALKCVNMMRPEFVMTVGDIVQGVTTPDRLRQQQTELTNFASKVKAPFFYVVGNHDITRSRPAYPLHHGIRARSGASSTARRRTTASRTSAAFSWPSTPCPAGILARTSAPSPPNSTSG